MNDGKSTISKQLVEIFENVMQVEHEFVNTNVGKKLSMSEIHTISAVGSDMLCSMGEIAEKLHITVGTLTVAINNLVHKGYVERYKSEKDRRIVKLGLTKQGKVIFSAHEAFHKNLVDAMIEDISEEEQVVVSKAMLNLKGFVDRGYQSIQTAKH